MRTPECENFVYLREHSFVCVYFRIMHYCYYISYRWQIFDIRAEITADILLEATNIRFAAKWFNLIKVTAVK